MSKKNTLTPEQIALLNEAYPVSESSSRLSLPCLGMLSKDITEETGTGKKKTIKVIEAAGTFYTERDLGEVDEDTGKKVWTKKYLSEEIDVIIVYHRKQLRMYDEGLKKFFSTPLYDSKDQVIPLYMDRKRVAIGTQEELQAKFPTTNSKGKMSSKLKEEMILFVIYEGELFQCNLSQSSKWAFMAYKKSLNPSTVTTRISSVEETFGSNTYRKMTFESLGTIDGDSFDLVLESQKTVKNQAEADAQYFLKNAETQMLSDGLDKELDEMDGNISAKM